MSLMDFFHRRIRKRPVPQRLGCRVKYPQHERRAQVISLAFKSPQGLRINELSKISLGAVIATIFVVGAATAPLTNAASPDDACSLLTQAQVTAALSVSVGAGSYQTPTFKKTCTWNATSDVTKGAKYVTLVLEGLDAYQAGKLAPVKTIVVTSISGIGDDAYYLAVSSNVGLIVKKGDIAFKVAAYGDLPIEKKQAMEKTLAQQVVSKL
jgi:hypothetical protein